MNVERNLNGGYTVSEMRDGFRVKMTFYGYTKRRAAQRFRLYHPALRRSGNYTSDAMMQ